MATFLSLNSKIPATLRGSTDSSQSQATPLVVPREIIKLVSGGWRSCRVGVVRASASSSSTEVVDDRRRRGVAFEEKAEKGRVLRVGVICGGPSAERGISLNSARSVIDHIQVHHILSFFI